MFPLQPAVLNMSVLQTNIWLVKWQKTAGGFLDLHPLPQNAVCASGPQPFFLLFPLCDGLKPELQSASQTQINWNWSLKSKIPRHALDGFSSRWYLVPFFVSFWCQIWISQASVAAVKVLPAPSWSNHKWFDKIERSDADFFVFKSAYNDTIR